MVTIKILLVNFVTRIEYQYGHLYLKIMIHTENVSKVIIL